LYQKVYQIGGDDFIIITVPEKAGILCAKIARYFDRLICRFYDPEDRAAGGIRGCDRSGRETFFPINFYIHGHR